MIGMCTSSWHVKSAFFFLLITNFCRIPSNCAFTSQHSDPSAAQTTGSSPMASLGIPNGGLQVVNPSAAIYDLILDRLQSPFSTSSYDFADQSLLADLFPGRWVPLPYIYNALKTIRWKGVHDAIWQDDKVKNVHYILSPKPWNEKNGGEGTNESHRWWWTINEERLEKERQNGVIQDGY